MKQCHVPGKSLGLHRSGNTILVPEDREAKNKFQNYIHLFCHRLWQSWAWTHLPTLTAM